jgi:hypothetical protein
MKAPIESPWRAGSASGELEPTNGTRPVPPRARAGAHGLGADESLTQREARHRRRGRLYAGAFLSVGGVVGIAALVAANRGGVEIDWIVGSTRISLAWIVLAATVVGWLAGIAMSVLFGYRTRALQHGKVAGSTPFPIRPPC